MPALDLVAAAVGPDSVGEMANIRIVRSRVAGLAVVLRPAISIRIRTSIRDLV